MSLDLACWKLVRSLVQGVIGKTVKRMNRYTRKTQNKYHERLLRPPFVIAPAPQSSYKSSVMQDKEKKPHPRLFALLLLSAASLYLSWSLVMFSKDLKKLLQLQKRRSPIVRPIDSYCEICSRQSHLHTQMPANSVHWSRSPNEVAD